MLVKEARLAFLDVETTGLFPTTGDRIVEIGVVVCRGAREMEQLSWLVNPDRPIPQAVQQIHGISDRDVVDCPPFNVVAVEICNALCDSWIVGHNIQFDIAFLAMEIAKAGYRITPLGCLDTCQLIRALWDLPNYKLNTVAGALGLGGGQNHRALSDAVLARMAFHHTMEKLGGWSKVSLADVQALHSCRPVWPDDPRRHFPLRPQR